MCVSPIHIQNKSPYYNDCLSYSDFDVPCGHCAECNNQRLYEWQTRLSFELSYWKSIGGNAVFLTFTYNNTNLPTLCFDIIEPETDCGFRNFSQPFKLVPCFDANHILGMLDQINARLQYDYGKGKYKYFIAAEYGKNTRRPHYHGLFMLAPEVDPFWFTEFCRGCWMQYGFMFPKLDDETSRPVDGVYNYVDNFGNPSTPLLRGFVNGSKIPLIAGAKYVSKYITKDISYFDIPEVQDAIKYLKHFGTVEQMKWLKSRLPKHWQSNGIGYTIFNHIAVNDFAKLDSLIVNGINNPLTKELVPLPSFVVNKLMYKNVRSERISPTTGKYLYDRELTAFGKAYLKQSYENRIKRTCQKMSEVFQQMLDNPRYPKDFLRHLDELGIVLDAPNTFEPVAIYHEVLKKCSYPKLCYFLYEHCDGRYENLIDLDASYRLYEFAKNIRYAKCNPPIDVPCGSQIIDEIDWELYSCASLDKTYSFVSMALRKEKALQMEKERERLDELRYIFNYKFDKRLC